MVHIGPPFTAPGGSGGDGDDTEIQSVAVVTGSEARPNTTAVVLWIGGTEEPDNLADGDIWLQET